MGNFSSLATEGCRNGGKTSARGRHGAKHSTVQTQQKRTSPQLWRVIRGMGTVSEGTEETDLRAATRTWPQGHPCGDPAACGELSWAGRAAQGSFLRGEEGAVAPET